MERCSARGRSLRISGLCFGAGARAGPVKLSSPIPGNGSSAMHAQTNPRFQCAVLSRGGNVLKGLGPLLGSVVDGEDHDAVMIDGIGCDNGRI